MDVGQSGSAATAGEQLSEVDSKILADLNTVKEKMDLLDSMLKPGADSPSPSVKNHEALLQVIGFLDACAPRMVELVEAAAQGALSGSVLETCLGVNDRLLKQLTEIDTLILTETPASTTAASAPAPTKEMSDLLLSESHEDDDDDDNHTYAKNPQAATKSTGEDDNDDDNIFGEKKPAASDAENAKKDSFDDFFEEQHGNKTEE
mgnify:CR=1 FL=1